ncbi:MAG: PSD1 and planctomycete cytochrome C domain-containing protein [Lentisphaeraceae bacterium]|nr:PSD1 and planctomycete cytochrome C domain-containing protein [Lentisphaeraceae bacterium]
MKYKCVVSVLLLFSLFVRAEDIDFNRQIRPILSDKCFFCHGPDETDIKGKLQLHTLEAAMKKLGKKKNRQALIPGDLDKSEMWQRIITDDEDDVMPPLDSHKTLTQKEKDLLKEWIKQGAKYDDHWSYKPIEKQAVSSIDTQLKSVLSKKGLSIAGKAEKRTLIRRLSFDLRGLPPTIQEIDSYLKDTSAKATEKLVDTFLADSHYGERMAAFWLDLVRFADSVGYHGDQVQKVYPYRDYVINAFNKNKKFDDFTREQLAGDLLPNRKDEYLVASCYNRLNMMTQEGGAQPKEYIAKYGADRVRTTTNAWLGSTVGCAECHDHKYDPFLAKDFYAFKAFFADVKQVGRYGGDFPPLAYIKDKENYPKYQKVKAEIDGIKVKLQDAEKTVSDDVSAKWAKEFISASKVKTALSRNGSDMTVNEDQSIFVSGKTPEKDTYEVTLSVDQPSDNILLEVMLNDQIESKSFGQQAANFVLSHVEVLAAGKRVKIKRAKADFTQKGFNIKDTLRSSKDKGWAVHGWEKKNQVNRNALFLLGKKVSGEITIKLHFNSKHKFHQFAYFRVSAQPSTVNQVFEALFKEKNTKKAYLTITHKDYKKLLAKKESLDNTAKSLEYGRAYFLVTESVKPAIVRILPRGNWMDDSGEIVEPAIPEFLGKLKTEGRATRLDLANWIVSKDNPLTSRVFVNRIWALMFGKGLAPITEDVGSQGEPPYYPQIVDNLAHDFRENWDIKKLVKRIVMTSAYQQRSDVSAKMKTEDPFNNLLTHQNSKRLQAEFVRDNALAASGLLNPKIGGRSVKPYQPAGHYSQLNFPKRKYQADMNEKQYRRGIYMHWQRTYLHPMLQAFDAPTREEACARRSISNTPLQALVLLNDPTFNEAAIFMAEKASTFKGDVAAKLSVMFEKTIARQPSQEELSTLHSYYQKELKNYQDKKKEVNDFLSIGMHKTHYKSAEVAALTTVARVILNLHESITVY